MKKIAVLLIITVTFLCACNSNKWIRKTVVKQNKFIVKFEQHQVEGKIVQQKYDHPFKIDPAVFERLMTDLTYSEQAGFIGEAEESPVFQEVEIERLAPVLADALAKADDSQRIRFTSFNQGKAFIFSVSRETEGVLFVEPAGRLNIAFNLINSEIDPNDPGDFTPGLSRVDPLKIKAAGTTIIPTSPYAELHKRDDDKTAPMWLIADLKKLKDSIKNTPATIVEVKKEVPPADITPAPQSAPAATSVAPKPVVIKQPETKKPVPVQTSEETIQTDIKNKLKYLKELLDEGLISEKDYNAKKEKLLEKLD